MNHVTQFFPSPSSGNWSPRRAFKMCSVCSQSRLGLRGNPRCANSMINCTTMSCSSFVNQLFFPLVSVRLLPPLLSQAKVFDEQHKMVTHIKEIELKST